MGGFLYHFYGKLSWIKETSNRKALFLLEKEGSNPLFRAKKKLYLHRPRVSMACNFYWLTCFIHFPIKVKDAVTMAKCRLFGARF